MKHKKDLPSKFRRFVRWAVYNPEGHQLHNWKYRSNALKNARRHGKDFTVLPVLSLPLSMISKELRCHMGKYFPHPMIHAKVPR